MADIMKKYKLPTLIFLILFILGCTEKSESPTEAEFPEKLYPYETSFDLNTFKERRDNLINSIPENGIVVITTNDLYLRNGDVNYEFRPESNFYYLTGFDEPNAIAVIRENVNNSETSELIMFVEEREGVVEQWLGPVYGTEGAVELFGADSAYSFGQFGSKIKSYFSSVLYQNVYANFDINTSVADSFYYYVEDEFTYHDIAEITYPMRMIKSPIEINAIQKAVDVAVQAFTEAMMVIEPGMYEYEVDALFDYILRLNGCPRNAFPTIVASGPNINTLHYEANQRKMLDGDLVMIDFGAEYGYYASDITRTLPVNGNFSNEQETIYEIVLEAHEAVIAAAVPGESYYYLYYLARDIILDRLIEKGIITGNKSDIISNYTYRRYIPAGLGHCVGLDVHDPFPGTLKGDKILQENMVLAFEPHIYLYEDDTTVNQEYWNVSARIEDVILITEDGCQVLSSALPRTIASIERLMNE